MNHPKFLVVQVCHRLLAQSDKQALNLQEYDKLSYQETRHVCELIRYCLDMDQEEVERHLHKPTPAEDQQDVNERMCQSIAEVILFA